MNSNTETSQIKLGVDFGTAYSSVSYKTPELPDPQPLLPNAYSRMTNGIPSLFWSDKDGNIRVGMEVEKGNGEWNDVKGVVGSIKTKLDQKEIKLHGKAYTPVEIVQYIIRHVLAVAEMAMEEQYIDIPKEKSFVMGVPVKFGSFERELLKNAVKEIGYDVELLPEPIAAAIYHAGKDSNFRKVLVFDMGAGTFDAAFLEKNDSPSYRDPYPYRCPAGGFDGNVQAGDVIDEELTEYIKNKLSPRPLAKLAEKLQNKDTIEYHRLLQAARKIKESFSVRDDNVTDAFSLGNQAFSVTVTKEELEKVASPVIEKAVDICVEIVKNCHMEGQEFPIIMVGGMSNLHLVKEALSRRFPVQAKNNQIQIKNPSRAVSFGCAMYAEYPKVARKVAFGYAVASYRNNQSVLSVEIPAQAKLPCTIESRYATRHENQTAVEFRIYEVPNAKEGEYLPFRDKKWNNDMKVVHDFGKPVPMGTEVTFIITLTESGILNVVVEDENGRRTPKTFHVSHEVV